jgi:hypothetical protein
VCSVSRSRTAPSFGIVRAFIVTGALGIGMAAVVGCGESAKPLTRAQLLTKADATCRRINNKLSAGNSAKTPQQISHAASELVSYEQKGLAELSKLIPPASMASDWKAIIAGAQTLADDTVKIVERVKVEKDLKGAHALLAETSRVQERTVAIAKRDGFTDCSQLA